jgi:hypothetical protein
MTRHAVVETLGSHICLGYRSTNLPVFFNNVVLYKSPDSDQMLVEIIQAESETILSEIHKLINFICNKEELLDQWKEFINTQIYKKGNKIYCSNYRGTSLLST